MPDDVVESGAPQTATNAAPDLAEILNTDYGVNLGEAQTTPDEPVLSQTEQSESETPASESPDPEDPGASNELIDQLPAGLGDPEPEAAAESDADTEAPEAESEAPETNAGFVKQIKKLRKQRQEEQEKVTDLESQVANLQSQIESLQATQTPPAEDLGQFANVKDEAELKARTDEYRDLKRWLRANPEGGEYKGQSITEDQIPTVQDAIETALEDQAPAAREWLAKRRQQSEQNNALRQQYDDHCDATFDWLHQDDSVEAQTLQQAYQAVPLLEQMPQGKFWACLAVEGAKVLKARQQARAHKQKVAPAAKPATAPSPSAEPPRVNASSKEGAVRAAAAQFEKEPSARGFEKVLAEML